jgi:hypothetical protein
MEHRDTPVQILFATTVLDGILVDAVVTGVPSTRDPTHPGAGEPFSFLVDRSVGAPGLARAWTLLDEWARDRTTVLADTSSTAEQLVLRHDADELQLTMS